MNLLSKEISPMHHTKPIAKNNLCALSLSAFEIYLKTAQWLLDNSLTTLDYCSRTARRLLDDCFMTARQLPDDCFMTAWRLLNAGCSTVAWQLLDHSVISFYARGLFISIRMHFNTFLMSWVAQWFDISLVQFDIFWQKIFHPSGYNGHLEEIWPNLSYFYKSVDCP
jgi:hypothetical protein